MRRLAPFILLACGCVNAEAEVFLEASIVGPSATVETSALATGVSGSFQIQFHLGRRASEPSEVVLRGFTLSDAERVGLADLAVSTNPTFPITVPVNSDVEVAAIYVAEENLLEVEAVDTICGASGLRIIGVFEDPLRGGSINAASEVFSPGGCP